MTDFKGTINERELVATTARVDINESLEKSRIRDKHTRHVTVEFINLTLTPTPLDRVATICVDDNTYDGMFLVEEEENYLKYTKKEKL